MTVHDPIRAPQPKAHNVTGPFALSGLTFPFSLAPSATTTFAVTFGRERIDQPPRQLMLIQEVDQRLPIVIGGPHSGPSLVHTFARVDPDPDHSTLPRRVAAGRRSYSSRTMTTLSRVRPKAPRQATDLLTGGKCARRIVSQLLMALSMMPS